MIKKRWLIVTILTFIIILAWVIFDILHSRAQIEIPSQLRDLTEPIDPNFNTNEI